MSNELGHGFAESVCELALVIALQQQDLAVATQVALAVTFRVQAVGGYVADIAVGERVLVELKADKALLPEHQAQVINYLKATGLNVGLLATLETPRVQYRRRYWEEGVQRDGQDG